MRINKDHRTQATKSRAGRVAYACGGVVDPGNQVGGGGNMPAPVGLAQPGGGMSSPSVQPGGMAVQPGAARIAPPSPLNPGPGQISPGSPLIRPPVPGGIRAPIGTPVGGGMRPPIGTPIGTPPAPAAPSYQDTLRQRTLAQRNAMTGDGNKRGGTIKAK